ncbi:MAG: 50S ribosomal protein L20 [Candidatus Omnitrophica bacterium]|nr:50S ribosomal protein L20 [Candidatus Omnitrophota bacterium]
MARVKHAAASKRRRKRVLKLAKGQYGARSRLHRTAKESVARAMAYSYRDRKARKRDFRGLWITRINAACRAHDISYSKFMNGLKKANAVINRKMLAEIAAHDKTGFDKLVEASKKALGSK